MFWEYRCHVNRGIHSLHPYSPLGHQKHHFVVFTNKTLSNPKFVFKNVQFIDEGNEDGQEKNEVIRTDYSATILNTINRHLRFSRIWTFQTNSK